MKKLMSLLTSCVAAIGFVAAAPASATPLTTAWQAVDFSLASINDSTSLNFFGFDSKLGSLTGVVIKFTLTETLTDTIYNFNSKPVTVGFPNPVSATSTITAFGPLGLKTVNQLTTPGFSGVIAGAVNGVPTQKSSTITATNITSGPATITGDAIQLAKYVGGTNSIVIGVDGYGTQNGSLANNVLTGYDGNAYGTVYMQYIYDIPEPATIALFAMGLLALTQLRRRKL